MAGGGSFKEDSMAEKDRNQRMKEITQRLEQGVKEIFTSEMYMEYVFMTVSLRPVRRRIRMCW